MLLFLETGLLIWFGLNYALFTAVEPDPRVRGAYIQNSFRSNIAVVGVSLAQTMMGPAGVAAMSIATAVLVPTYNVLAVIALETCRGGRGDHLNALLPEYAALDFCAEAAGTDLSRRKRAGGP